MTQARSAEAFTAVEGTIETRRRRALVRQLGGRVFGSTTMTGSETRAIQPLSSADPCGRRRREGWRH
jgi:hypothetical protein